ncbi:hypothetical protein [Streptomyces sp. SGAir0957]
MGALAVRAVALLPGGVPRFSRSLQLSLAPLSEGPPVDGRGLLLLNVHGFFLVWSAVCGVSWASNRASSAAE